ncbi:TonB-dependent receptor [Ohtaekwangia koreensis]|uniref:TonB-dependent receptor n=1 Tax=Ohtaekwangia koreensis TaxID=688867 RepID=A0A1T5LBG9_9BACT|nr:TonB-dependent receptor [Ohtaekwangia koreensis]SKC73396.1 TonB-dependent receptor [Ohtaekwangia koreensis]
MHKNLQTFISKLRKLSLYTLSGILLQCLLFNFLLAKDGTAQNIYDVKLRLEVKDKTLKDVFSTIEEKTEFTFTYSSKKVDLAKKITLDGQQTNLGQILESISRQANIAVQQVDNLLMVKAQETAVVKKQAAANGVIRGRVVDEVLKSVLPGATIFQKGTNNGTTSDVNGEFFLRVPAGDVEIEVSYIGFRKYSEVVTVPENGVAQVELKMISDATELQDIVITGVLQGQQKALNQQKTADNIKNIVSADQIGRFPDPNVAEALQRVPAVNIERDQGEGRYVLVRGLAPQFTNISINGEQIPSPEASVRYVALDAVPADQLASIEVSKAITPDMDGDAIGGSVNLITRTAQTENISVNASGLMGYNNISGKANLQGSLELSKRFLNNKLGIMLNSSYYETERGSDNWERDEHQLELRDYELTRTRLGLSSTIDYKFNEKNEVYFRTLYNRFTDREQRRRYIFAPNAEDSPFEDNEIERLTKDRLEKQIVTSFNLGAKHTLSKFSLDYEVSYSEAIQDTPYDIEIGSVGEVDQLSTDFTTNAKFPTFTVDDLPNTSPQNIYLDNSIYEFDEATMGNTYAKDVNKTAKFNIGIPYKAGTSDGLFKFGGKVRLKEKSYRITENVFSYTGSDDITLDQYAGGTVDDNFLDGRYKLSANADPEKFVKFFNANRNDFELSIEDKLATEAAESFTAKEDVYAGYIMSKLQLSKLMILGGLRYEHTSVDYTSSNVINESEIIPEEGGTDYSFLLPQLHIRYNITDNMNLRAAITRSYARPNFSDIIPAQEININEGEGTIGNAKLKPVAATNVDILAEKYFGSVGILSGGIFYKRLTDFIFNRRFESDQYPGSEGQVIDITQARNGESASLFGFEVAYQQNLTFLPGALKGLSIYANYTLTTSNAKIQSRDDNTSDEEIRLPGQSKHVGNISLGYDLGRFNFRVAANFNGEYISEIGGSADEDLYVKDRVQLDATTTFTISPKLRFFAEFLNITNQPFQVYQGEENRYIQREFYSWWTRAGLKLDL